MDYYAALGKELTCTLCDELFKSASTFSTCGHTFCHECVIHTLEGIGINTSQCPTCKQPGWKKDLRPNHQYNNAVEHLKALGKFIESKRIGALAAGGAGDPLAPAAGGATTKTGTVSLAHEDPSEEAHSQEDEEIARSKLPSTEPVLEELDFGPAWRAALQNQLPPTTVEELKALQEEIALLESALQLCQTMPCAGEEEEEEQENRDVENHPQQQQEQQQQQPSTSGGPGISLSGKPGGTLPGRKQARKLSELASQQHNNNTTNNMHGAQDLEAIPAEQQTGIVPATEETTKDEGAPAAVMEQKEATTTATAATSPVARSPSQKRDRRPGESETRSAKRPRVEQHPLMDAAVQTAAEEEKEVEMGAIGVFGIVPDSQPSIDEVALRGNSLEERGNLEHSNSVRFAAATAAATAASDGAATNGAALLGGSPVGLNTQSAAEFLHGIGCNNGFIAASQLPLNGGRGEGDIGGGGDGGGEHAAVPKQAAKQVAVEELAQPFGLAFPAPAPRSTLEIMTSAPIFNSAGPSYNNNSSSNTSNLDTNRNGSKFSAPSYHRSSALTASQNGRASVLNPHNNASAKNTANTDIRTLLLSQKAAQEAANTAAPSQTPMCLAFAMSDQQLKEKVQAVQEKLPTLTYMHSVSEATTHVIVATDDSLIAEKRSRIYLEGLARGCWVVSTAWLEACLDTGIRVKESIYEVKGCRVLPSRFNQDDWLATNVLGGPERCRLLVNQGRKLFAKVKETIRVEKFEESGKTAGRLREIVLSLLRFAGANVIESGRCDPETTIVLTNDKNVAGGFLLRGYKHVLDARWVLDSVSCCKVLPEARYLFERQLE